MAPLIDVPNNPATHGKNSRVFMTESGTGTPKYVGSITEWTLDMATDKVETTALGDDNKTYVQGLKDIKGTIAGNFDALDDALFMAADSADGVLMEIYPTGDSAIKFAGPAYIDISIKGGVSSAVTFDGTFQAKGNWTRTMPTTP